MNLQRVTSNKWIYNKEQATTEFATSDEQRMNSQWVLAVSKKQRMNFQRVTNHECTYDESKQRMNLQKVTSIEWICNK